MGLHLIGIGLHDENDITLKGLEAVKNADHVYLESYTSLIDSSIDKLEKLYGKEIFVADRELVEKHSDEILEKAKDGEVAFLIIGDIFGATTHMDLVLRAQEKGIKVYYVFNASVLTVVGGIGLELYKFGKTTSIPFENKNVKTPVDVFKKNYENGMHTLFLLDLDPGDNNFLNINAAAKYLIEHGVDKNILAIGCTHLGSRGAQIKTRKLEDLQTEEFSNYPQSIIIPAKELHFIEEEAIKRFK
jgi:diphthine synthase